MKLCIPLFTFTSKLYLKQHVRACRKGTKSLPIPLGFTGSQQQTTKRGIRANHKVSPVNASTHATAKIGSTTKQGRHTPTNHLQSYFECLPTFHFKPNDSPCLHVFVELLKPFPGWCACCGVGSQMFARIVAFSMSSPYKHRWGAASTLGKSSTTI